MEVRPGECSDGSRVSCDSLAGDARAAPAAVTKTLRASPRVGLPSGNLPVRYPTKIRRSPPRVPEILGSPLRNGFSQGHLVARWQVFLLGPSAVEPGALPFWKGVE